MANSRTKIFSIITTATAVAVLCLLLAVHESLNRELNMVTSQGTAFMAGLMEPDYTSAAEKYLQEVQQGYLFRPAFVESIQPVEEQPRTSFWTPEMINGVKQLSAVDWVYPIIWSNDTLFLPSGSYSLMIVPPEYFQMLGLKPAQGDFPSGETLDQVVIGSELYRELVEKGETIELDQQIKALKAGWRTPLSVSAILEPVDPRLGSMYMLQNRWLFLPLTEKMAAQVELRGAETHTIWVHARNGNEKKAVSQITEYLETVWGITEELTFFTPEDAALSEFFSQKMFLKRFNWAIALCFLVAFLNTLCTAYAILFQERRVLSIRRCIGASRTDLVKEYLAKGIQYGLISAGLGLLLALLLAQLFGNSLQVCEDECIKVDVKPGLISLVSGSLAGVGLWVVGFLWPLWNFLRQPPIVHMREARTQGVDHNRLQRVMAGIGFSVSILALITTLAIRDSFTAHINDMLDQLGGERSGSFVDWHSSYAQPGGKIRQVTKDHYALLKNRFPDIPIGWMASKGDNAEIEVLTASANLVTLRPPLMLAGRWISEEEEQKSRAVVVLGFDLAQKISAETGVPVSELVGQQWKGNSIVGVMQNWPMMRGQGYYPDVGYIPVFSTGGTGPFDWWPLVGQIPFNIPENMDMDQTLGLMSAAIKEIQFETIENTGEPQILLVNRELKALLDWRNKFHEMLGLFSIACLFLGGMGIMSSTLLWVAGRWREIGIHRAIGATQFNMFIYILRQAVRSTLIYALAGILSGLFVGAWVQYSEGVKIGFYPSWVFLSLGVAVFVALVFGGMPALWASLQRPIKTIRFME